mmetsp:Transcript_123463/g.354746  ORF Transcript_123463/g.354746 Transcript_123463/m.354746 type:complete len:89 (+) Transcript_123463:1466-1732(+)
MAALGGSSGSAAMTSPKRFWKTEHAAIRLHFSGSATCTVFVILAAMQLCTLDSRLGPVGRPEAATKANEQRLSKKREPNDLSQDGCKS